MIIPVKCFTCGNVIANKYEYYLSEVRRLKMSRGMDTEKVIYLTKEYIHKTPEGEVMDKLKLNKMCCRRHFLTHVDIEWINSFVTRLRVYTSTRRADANGLYWNLELD